MESGYNWLFLSIGLGAAYISGHTGKESQDCSLGVLFYQMWLVRGPCARPDRKGVVFVVAWALKPRWQCVCIKEKVFGQQNSFADFKVQVQEVDVIGEMFVLKLITSFYLRNGDL